MVQEQAIIALIKRIPSGSSSSLSYTKIYINDIADINEIREKGGIKPIVNLLTSPNETLQAHTAKALSVISADGMKAIIF